MLNKSLPVLDKISLGIVTYNSAATIFATLQSLVDADFGGEVDIFLCDNGSMDATFEIITEFARRHENIQIIQGRDNLGFGRSHNRILNLSKADFHIICNPDIVVRPDFFSKSLSFLKLNPGVGLMSPRMIGSDGKLQYSNRRFPSILDLALRRFTPSFVHFIFKSRMDRYIMKDLGYDHVYDVPFCSGALMVCRRVALECVGGFDPRFFLYFEDADLSRALQQAGWRTTFNPNVSVVHIWKRDSYHNLRIAFIMIWSAVRYFRKWGWRLF